MYIYALPRRAQQDCVERSCGSLVRSSRLSMAPAVAEQAAPPLPPFPQGSQYPSQYFSNANFPLPPPPTYTVDPFEKAEMQSAYIPVVYAPDGQPYVRLSDVQSAVGGLQSSEGLLEALVCPHNVILLAHDEVTNENIRFFDGSISTLFSDAPLMFSLSRESTRGP